MTLIYRVLYLIYRVLARASGWARRRMTDAGLAVAGAVGLTMVVGVDTEHNVDYQAFPLLFFMLTVGLVFLGSFRARLSARRVLPRFATAGTPMTFSVTVSNHSKRVQRGVTLLEQLADPLPSFQEWHAVQAYKDRTMRSFRIEQRQRMSPFNHARIKEASVPPVPPGEDVQVQLQYTPTRRGVLRFKEVLLSRTDPLGLFRSFVRVRLPQSLLVLPKRYRVPPIALPGAMKYQQGGVAMASSVGQSDEFAALRDYRHGDPIRHIHWRSWARVGRPVVKEFEDENFVRHALVLDTYADTDHGEIFEEAVSVAASFACSIQTQESLLDLLFVGAESYCFTSGRGLAHGDQMLEILASVRACRQRSFAALESLVVQHALSVSGCICVLIAWNKERQDFVRKLRLLGVPMLVLLVTAPGTRRPDPGPMRDQPENFHVLEVGKIQEGLLALG